MQQINVATAHHAVLLIFVPIRLVEPTNIVKMAFASAMKVTKWSMVNASHLIPARTSPAAHMNIAKMEHVSAKAVTKK